MAATPAWPLDSGIRLFVEQELGAGLEVALEGPQAHYLLHVMRLRAGAGVRVFDDRTGEWAAELVEAGKKACRLRVREQVRGRETVPDLWLGAAPIRRARYDWVAEKACELGVARFTPVLTRRAVVDKVNDERLRAHMVEAAEQCGRTALPRLDSAMELRTWLAAQEGRTLLFADEEGGVPLREAAANAPVSLLVGPEGGFDGEERKLVKTQPGAVAVSLGPRILRADTAAVALVAAWMAVAGDWIN